MVVVAGAALQMVAGGVAIWIDESFFFFEELEMKRGMCLNLCFAMWGCGTWGPDNLFPIILAATSVRQTKCARDGDADTCAFK